MNQGSQAKRAEHEENVSQRDGKHLPLVSKKMWTVHKLSECKLKDNKNESKEGSKQEKQFKKALTLKVMTSLFEMSDDDQAASHRTVPRKVMRRQRA